MRFELSTEQIAEAKPKKAQVRSITLHLLFELIVLLPASDLVVDCHFVLSQIKDPARLTRVKRKNFRAKCNEKGTTIRSEIGRP